MKSNLILLAVLILSVLGCKQETQNIAPAKAQKIAKEAYIYGFPLVMNYKILYAYMLGEIILISE